MRKLALYSALGILFLIALASAIGLMGRGTAFERQKVWSLGMTLICYSVVSSHSGRSRGSFVTFISLLIAGTIAALAQWNQTSAALIIAACATALFDGIHVARLASRRK
jgi:hypothetical protein